VPKLKLRKKYRDIRSHVTPALRHEAALAAASHFLNMPQFKQSKHIACYLSLKDEFDSAPIIEAIWNAKKICYIPVLAEKNKDQNYLRFVRYEYGDPLHMNRYSILEPTNFKQEINPDEIDIVILPLLAFDKHGHRLGTGGGYYDRTFEFHHGVLRDDPNKKPKLIGLGYAAQQAESVPEDPWDIVLDGVITEKAFIPCF
jgi:5-formyltetrahydrofolate cyclo-ligase